MARGSASDRIRQDQLNAIIRAKEARAKGMAVASTRGRNMRFKYPPGTMLEFQSAGKVDGYVVTDGREDPFGKLEYMLKDRDGRPKGPIPEKFIDDAIRAKTGRIAEGIDTLRASGTLPFNRDMQELITQYQEVVGSNQRWQVDTRDGTVSFTQFAAEAKAKAKPKPKPKPRDMSMWDSVIIADDKKQQILEALEQINQFDLIFNKWGFDETIEKGKGVSMLFYGPPGTGKTLVCQAIAKMMNKKLMVLSTADIESSAPGEAERNIRKFFKEAKEKKSILLFDECDSLIFTRKNAGPILGAQINELLTNIEKFDGVTMFTTNRLGTLDEAVNRRLALKLELGMPDAAQRAEIWKRMFPKKAPVAKDIDFDRLAIIEVTGGYIKNAVLRAARMAATEKKADSRKKITMEHLLKAMKLEAESMVDFDKARNEYDSGIGRVTQTPGMGMTGGTIGLQRDMKSQIESSFGNNV